MTRQGKRPSYKGRTRQLNRRKRVTRVDKTVRNTPPLSIRKPTKHQANGHYKFSEDLVQTQESPVFATSVYGSLLTNSVD